MSGLPDSVALALPDLWDDIPMERGKFDDFVKGQRRHLRESGTFDTATLRQIELAYSCLYQLARAGRVMLMSSYAAVETRGEGDDDLAVMATVAVSSLHRSDMGTNVPLLAEVLVKAFADHEERADTPVRFDEIEPPAVYTVAGIESAKLVRLMTVSGDVGQRFRQFSQSYLVPVANGDAVIVLQFSTINLEYARQFSELFEKVAGTLRVLYPDDPTFLDDGTSDLIEPIES